ncbi:hypothetical protein WJX81_007860 [Elliptochloris bilobata]|uniref:phosphoglycerate dehydrogenase n=1 Tax=Elliptochloris bilobata TaxID=381761 RepID=A0AAW1RMX0_9CHLO
MVPMQTCKYFHQSRPTSFPLSNIKVLLLEGVSSSALNEFRAEAFIVETLATALSEEEVMERIQDVHVLGIRSKTRVTATALGAARRLLAVGCFCIGTNQAAKLRGVPVFNAPFSNTRSVAELTIAEVVALARQLGDRSNEMHAGTWRKVSRGCYEVGVLAEMLGMRVVYFDPLSKMAIGNAASRASLKEVLESADFVTLHVPATPATANLMGAAELSSMRKGSYLLNNSRGSVVDVAALAAALRSGALGGAAVDVFPSEPERNGDGFATELQGLPNMILTPHVGGSTEEAQAAIGLEVASALIKYINIGSSAGAVNFPQMDHPEDEDSHRVLNVHHNVPGVLRDVNRIISDLDANIKAQVNVTDSDIGYLMMDINKEVSNEVKDALKQLPSNIRTRILY